MTNSYLDCGTCGPQGFPRHNGQGVQFDNAKIAADTPCAIARRCVWYLCPTCGISLCSHAVREIAIPKPVARGFVEPGECDNRCLNGKRSCGCRCGGLCHGMGTCYCRELATAAFVRGQRPA